VSGTQDKKSGGAGEGGSGSRRRRPQGSSSQRDGLPRRVGEVLTPALDRLATSEESRAYSAWARAVGDPVSGGTRPKAFRRGQLTVECASSVWANELTYLGPQILRRMDEVAPGHPVERFRFVVGHLQPPPPGDRQATEDDAPPPQAGQGSGGSAAKEKRRDQRPAEVAEEAARAQAEGVRDERLRASIEAALRRSSQEPPQAPGRGTPTG
jgi:hypothetical protein